MTDDELRQLIDDPDSRRQVSAVDLAMACLERIDASRATVNAFITITPELALADAARVDCARAASAPLPLDGLPVAVKDNIDVGGVRTTAGSKFFEHSIAIDDAEVVRRLRSAGGLVVGKAALHEFAFGVTCDNPFYGTTHNPWDLERIPGGSSGGSGAALAADLCIGALGTDTGGSVRIPAALTGVTALRPTFGRVSNRGVFPCCWSLDTVGQMARSAADLGRLFGAIDGYDPQDPAAVPPPPVDGSLDENLRSPLDLAGVRIGIPTDFFFDDIEPEVEAAVRAAAGAFSQLGARVVDIAVAQAEGAREVCERIIRAEALAHHRHRFQAHPELFGEDVRRRLKLGESVSGVDFAEALRQMSLWRLELRRVFDQVDLLLTPATPCVAPRIAESETLAATRRLTWFTYPWSLAHIPALVAPCGFTRSGLPIGLQLAAAPWRDSLLVGAAEVYQRATSWHQRRPAEALADRPSVMLSTHTNA